MFDHLYVYNKHNLTDKPVWNEPFLRAGHVRQILVNFIYCCAASCVPDMSGA
jgi:hypothetical protein